MTSEEIVHQIQNGVNVQENLGQLYQKNRNLIYKVCHPFAEYAEMDDLMQEAYFGLVNAVDDYDETLGYKFSTYATWKIKASCASYIANNRYSKRIPAYLQELIRQYRSLVSELGHLPDKETTMNHLKISEVKYDLLVIAMYQKDTMSLDDPIAEDADGKTIGDTVASDINIEDDVIASIEGDSLSDLWKSVIDNLDERKSDIILKLFRDEQTVTSLAEAEGVTVQRISDLKNKALKKLSQVTEIIEFGKAYDFIQRLDRLEDKVAVDCYSSKIAYHGSNPTEDMALHRISNQARWDKMKEWYSQNFGGDIA